MKQPAKKVSICGIDFTSRPCLLKLMTCARGSFTAGCLLIEEVVLWEDFPGFEAFLKQPGPWRAGIDFPFSQPRKFLSGIGLATEWESVVKALTAGTKLDFKAILDKYRAPRPVGDKQHLRVTDILAKSCSPMMLYGVPVAKMFYEGAPRLLRSGASILPVRPVPGESRIVVEAYPKLVAQRYSEGQPYKAESKKKQTQALSVTRERILAGLKANCAMDFGFRVEIAPDVRRQAIDDGSGDILDSVLCAVQAAWSHQTAEPPDGISMDCDPLEGWIVDPGLIVQRP